MSSTMKAEHGSPLIDVTVIGQEGDEQQVTINPNEPVLQLLREALRKLYGTPTPDPERYDVVVGGKWVEPLTTKVADAGIRDGATVSVLPKEISRGYGV